MNQKRFNLINNVVGWLVFAVAAFTYLSTIEPTVSLWDCGEFIAGSYKLEVVHPPGAPFFLMFNHLFTMLASTPQQVPILVNASSALATAFTVLFLFWTITLLARKVIIKDETNISVGQVISVFGAGVVGAIAYNFSDTSWFSGVEGEVYALSSFFTALVFWLMLKWERRADEPYNMRWIILIFYLMGLSIGVHLLSLLVIPVFAFVYYFRKFPKVNPKGVLVAFGVGLLILGVINVGVIKWFPLISSKFELLFVNTMGLPYWSGVIFTVILYFALTAYGIYWTEKNNKSIANVVIVGIGVIMIGFMSYAMVPIRSLANTPIDYSNPDDIFNLMSYLNREQYGDRPLVWGPDFNSQPTENKEGKTIYIQRDGHYENIGKQIVPKYDQKDYMFFPRMGDTREDRADGYRAWSGMRKSQKHPTFAQNITFFVRYQLGHMYWRYFAWNFIGRQNDDQGHGPISDNGCLEGNWLSGINFIDEARLGPQDKLPFEMRVNRAHNRLYFLPFILGLLGLYFYYKNNKKDTVTTLSLFFITGILLIIYQNSPPFEPRERDYTLVGSFYTYCIWIGFGVLQVIEFLRKKLDIVPAAAVATAACFVAVPVLMANQEWDDHTRAKRYSSRDFGTNYLYSCAKDAILYTNGDNDTYPLWYAEEVEGIRDDVRVINLQLLMTDWYMEQLSQKKNNSSAINFSIKPDQIVEGKRDWIIFYQEHPVWSQRIDKNAFYDISEVIKFIGSDDEDKVLPYGETKLNFFPTNKMFVPVDTMKVRKLGIVNPKFFNRIVPRVEFSVGNRNLLKNYLLVLDMIASNNWERPIYFGITSGSETYLGLQDYFQQEGMTYRLTPVKATEYEKQGGEVGRTDAQIMYTNVTKYFKWGNLTDPDVYVCSVTRRHLSNYRSVIGTLAKALLAENEKKKCIEVIDLVMKELPEAQVPYGLNILPLAEMYYMAGDSVKAKNLANKMFVVLTEKLDYYLKLNRDLQKQVKTEASRAVYGLRVIGGMGERMGDKALVKKVTDALGKYETKFGNGE